jgi:RND family efflux transporter MFP subunit
MNRAPEPMTGSGGRAPRAWIGWTIVAVAGAVIAASFLYSSDEDAQARRAGGPRATPVAVGVVERGSITERGRYPGELDADAADVAAFYGGRLVAVRVRVGDTVKQGDVVAELDPVDAREQIAQAQAQASAAEAEQRRVAVELEAAAVDLKRLEALQKDQLISGREVDTQRAKTEALRATLTSARASGASARAGVRLLQKRVVESVVRAPFAGRIAGRYVDPGAIVAAGTRLVRVVAVAPLRVRFEVPEHEVAGLSRGAALRVVTGTRGGPAADPSTGAAATVSGVASEVSRDRRVATVEALIDAPPQGWLPGMYAEAIVDRRTIAQATIVPAVSILSRLQPSGAVATGVFVVDGGVARWTPVTLVVRDGQRAAVEAPGLPPGARVLVTGHVDLADGSRVAIVEGGGR